MKKRIISMFLVFVMVVSITPLWSMADESTLVTTITVSLPESKPQAGIAPYFPTILAVNGDTALTDCITFYAEWYESSDDLRHSPGQYTELSTENFVLDMYYNLYVGITAQYGYEIASDCQLIAILPDNSKLEASMYDYDPELLFAGFDFLFDKTGLPITTIFINGYEVGAPVRGVVFNDNRVDMHIAPEGTFDFYNDNEGTIGSKITDANAVFVKDQAYWAAVMVLTDGNYDLGKMSKENFVVSGGCEDLMIVYHDVSNNILFVAIRLNRFEKPAQTNVCVENYMLGNQGYDVSVAVESQVFDFPVGGGVPYALYYPNGDEVGVSVREDYLNPEIPYWLGLIVTNDTGDYSAYTKYDFVLDIPYTSSYIEKNVEYVEIYFQLEPLSYQAVERLDFELDGYYGGAALDQVTLGLEQDGFLPYSEYNDHFGFHYDNGEEPGTYITPSEAATLVFDNSEVLWLWVNVQPLYNTVFAPPPEVSLNVDYTECLMQGRADGSLDIAFKLAPLQKPNDLVITVSGYENEGDILEFEAAVNGNGAERYPGGYLDGYGIFADDNNEPGALLTQGTFEEETSYWAYIAMFPENGFDLSALKAEDFTFDGFAPEKAIGIYDQDKGTYYLYFKLPQIQLNAISEMITFYLDGYELGGEINQVQVSHNSGQINMNDNYLAGYVILPEHEGKPDDLNFYQEGTFTAGSTYWLGIAISPAEGYSLSKVRGEQFLLDVFDCSQVFVDVASSTEAYVYFKLPPVKVAHRVIFTLGGEDGILFGYSVPDGTCINEPAEPVQEGKVFLGWYTQYDGKWDFSNPVTKDLTLTAKFEDATPIETQPIDLVELMGAPLKYEVGKTIGEFAFDLTVPGNVTIFAADGEKAQTWVSSQYDAFSILTIDEPPAPNALFASDKYYYVVTVLVADEGYRFAEGMVATINGQPATVEIITNEGVTLAYVAIGYDKATGMLIGTYNTNYAIDVVLNGYTIGGKVADAAVVGNSSFLEIVSFADEENFYILADKNGEPDYDSTVTEFAANTQYWLMVGLETAGGGDLAVTDVVPDKITCNGKPVDLMFDDDALMVVFKLPLLSDSTVPYGDVNGDGKVDATDALMVLQAAVNKITLTDDQRLAADVNEDESIDAKDALEILKYAVSKPSALDKFYKE